MSEPQSQSSEDVATLSVSEPLYDQVACDRMSASVRDSIAKGKRTIIIDLAGCTVLSAYGVGQLISVNELAKSASSSLSIKGIKPEIFALLKQLMVDQILPIQGQ